MIEVIRDESTDLSIEIHEVLTDLIAHLETHFERLFQGDFDNTSGFKLIISPAAEMHLDILTVAFQRQNIHFIFASFLNANARHTVIVGGEYPPIQRKPNIWQRRCHNNFHDCRRHYQVCLSLR